MTSHRLEQLRLGALNETTLAATVLALDNVCRLAIARVEFLERKASNVVPLRKHADATEREEFFNKLAQRGWWQSRYSPKDDPA